MYLATYLSYDGVHSERKRMAELLGLKRKTFDRFFSEVTDAGMLIKTDDGYTMDRNYFVRGKVEYPLYQSLYQVYACLIRSHSPRLHQYLGYIFLMMPYVNVQWNIVCHNPLEDHLEVIEPMTLGEFCDAIGYERNNAQRLLDNYRKITFNWKGKQQYFCTFFYTGYAHCVQPQPILYRKAHREGRILRRVLRKR